MFKKLSVNSILLLLIIFIAAILRFWNYSNMQFMYDELSALFRSQAGSFMEIIQKAKLSDVHPVGVHVFVHYYTILFGNSEMALRFPFILSGIVSIYFSYKTAALWFNNTVALLCAACLASLQFPIMYSQLERPYAAGILFASVMVYCWSEFFFSVKKNKTTYLSVYVLSSVLCMYTHYFCLLFAFIVGATGLFFITKHNFKQFIVAGICIALLFTPHLPIFFYHFSLGGMAKDSWLATPGNDWLWVFIKYLFHYSPVVLLMMVLLFAASIFIRDKTRPVFYRFRVIALLWGLSLFLIVFPYSILKAPTLQFSTMTFTLPFLLMFLFSFFKDVSSGIKIILVSAILIVNTTTLFAVRRHNIIFYHQPYDEMAITSLEMLKNYGDKNVSIALGGAGRFMDYYFEKYNKRFAFLPVDTMVAKQFKQWMANQTGNYFVAGNVPVDFLEIIKETYPYIINKNEGFTYSLYCFSKQNPATEVKELVIYENALPATVVLDSTHEYSQGITLPLKTLIASRHSIVNISAKVTVPDSASNPILVMEIHNGDSLVSWNGADFKNFCITPLGSNTMYLSKLFSSYDLSKLDNAEVKIYVWNRDKKAATIEVLKVQSIKSNPVIYGLYEPLE